MTNKEIQMFKQIGSLRDRIEVLERALKEVLEKGSNLKKYHAFIPDAETFLKFEQALESAKEVLE